MRRVAESGAEGVLFCAPSFCDPALLDQPMAVRAGVRRGFSVLLHGMTPELSLRLQERGLGELRLQGCGIVVPYKSVAAV